MKINERIEKIGGKYVVLPKRGKKKLGTHDTYKEALAQLRAIEISKAKNESQVLTYDQFILEKKSNHPQGYKAPEGSRRDAELDRAAKLYREGKTEEAAKIRREMEERARKKSNWKNTPRKDSKAANESRLNEAKKKGGCNLSKETEAKIRAVAKKKGYTFGSLKSEYCKGLGAYVSSGSRPGMTAHQWAMARVNAASPSKSWANVKKSKGK